MKNQFELIIEKDGTISTIYQDGLAKALDAEEAQVCRASNVEWEDVGGHRGWTVRSAKSPEYVYLRRSPSDPGVIEVTTNGRGLPAAFQSREEALAEEVKHFWEILGEQETGRQP